jgi:hypothetical protein
VCRPIHTISAYSMKHFVNTLNPIRCTQKWRQFLFTTSFTTVFQARSCFTTSYVVHERNQWKFFNDPYIKFSNLIIGKNDFLLFYRTWECQSPGFYRTWERYSQGSKWMAQQILEWRKKPMVMVWGTHVYQSFIDEWKASLSWKRIPKWS